MKILNATQATRNFQIPPSINETLGGISQEKSFLGNYYNKQGKRSGYQISLGGHN